MYKYKLIDKDGNISIQKSATLLPEEASNYKILYYEEIKESRVLNRVLSYFNKMTLMQKSVMFKQIAMYLKSGYALQEILNRLKHKTLNVNIKKVYSELYIHTREYGELSAAFESTGQFEPAVIHQIKAAEESGRLYEMLEELSNIYRKKVKQKRMLQAIVSYPIFLMLVMLGSVTYISTMVIPSMESFFVTLNVTLSPIVIVGLGIVKFLGVYGFMLLFGTIVICMTLVTLYNRSKTFRLTIDTLLLRIPVLGYYVLINDLINFLLVFASMLDSNVPFDILLESSIASISNTRLYKRVKMDVDLEQKFVKDGYEIAQALEFTEMFNADDLSFIETGSETGTLSTVMRTLVDFKTDEFDSFVDRVAKILPGVFLVVFGIVLLIVFGSIFKPIMDSASQIGF